jgi:hypothetical protein
MNVVVPLVLLALSGVAASADVLKLRDGRAIPGQFLGATRTEIWFQRDAPGEVINTMAYPIVHVESLTFGVDARQSIKADGVAKKASPLGGCSESQGIFTLTAWHTSPCKVNRTFHTHETLRP